VQLKTSLEARRHPRAELATTAVVLTKTRYVGTYLVRNLSVGGALFVGDAILGVGHHIRILLQLQGLQPVALDAEVVRTESHESGERFFAAAFREVPASTERAIDRLVGAHLDARRRSSSAVLVLDGSAETCRALHRDLDGLGYQAITATSPLEAVARLHAVRERMSTAIVDARLRHSDGLEFLAFLAEDQPLVRRVVMSSDFGTTQLELTRKSSRVHAFLAKPWDRDTLAIALG
jgi:CheY-like chemotaxis protein